MCQFLQTFTDQNTLVSNSLRAGFESKCLPVRETVTMPWVSNHTPQNITVQITKTTGGSDNVFTVQPAIPYSGGAAAIPESSGENYWTRTGNETLTAVIGGKKKSFSVAKDDHVTFYTNFYEIFTAKFQSF